jgi:hypothetical protein
MNEGKNLGYAYVLFGLVILGSIYAIPFIILYGCLCFRDKIKIFFGRSRLDQKFISHHNLGVEMKSPLLSNKFLQEDGKIIFNQLADKKTNQSNFPQNEKKTVPTGVLEEPKKKAGTGSLAKSLCECLKGSGSKIVTKTKQHVAAHGSQFVKQLGKELLDDGLAKYEKVTMTRSPAFDKNFIQGYPGDEINLEEIDFVSWKTELERNCPEYKDHYVLYQLKPT